MSDLGAVTFPVWLRVGDFEEEIGEIEAPLTATTEPSDTSENMNVTAKVDYKAFTGRLSALLRAAADEIDTRTDAT